VDHVEEHQPARAFTVEAERLAYPPGWFDRIAGWVTRLPGHYMIYDAGFGALIGLCSIFTGDAYSQAYGPFSTTTRAFGGFLIASLVGSSSM
jgi:hypothetical protein